MVHPVSLFDANAIKGKTYLNRLTAERTRSKLKMSSKPDGHSSRKRAVSGPPSELPASVAKPLSNPSAFYEEGG